MRNMRPPAAAIFQQDVLDTISFIRSNERRRPALELDPSPPPGRGPSGQKGGIKRGLRGEVVRRCVGESRWGDLREFGRKEARKLAIKESDVERLVQEYRSGH